MARSKLASALPSAGRAKSPKAKTRKRRAPASLASHKPRAKPAPPQGGRSLATYEKLIKAAGELLAEVGFEKLTTNAICARAGLTPPALYRYFRDKYEVLEALARRLLKRHTDAFAAWTFQGGAWEVPGNRAALEKWFRTSVGLTLSEPGAIWTLRALRALPNLAHIRRDSQRQVTDQLFEFLRRVYPEVPAAALWCRLRIIAEFAFTVDELALEESRVPHDVLFREAARILAIPYDSEFRPPKVLKDR